MSPSHNQVKLLLCSDTSSPLCYHTFSPRAPGAQTGFRSSPVQGTAKVGMWRCMGSRERRYLPLLPWFHPFPPQRKPHCSSWILPPKSHHSLITALQASLLTINSIFCYFDKKPQCHPYLLLCPTPQHHILQCELAGSLSQLSPGRGWRKEGENGWADGSR